MKGITAGGVPFEAELFRVNEDLSMAVIFLLLRVTKKLSKIMWIFCEEWHCDIFV